MNTPDEQPPPANTDLDWRIRQAAIAVAAITAQFDLPHEQTRNAVQSVITGLITGNPELDGALIAALIHSLGGLTLWALTDYAGATPDQAAGWLTDQAIRVQNAAENSP